MTTPTSLEVDLLTEVKTFTLRLAYRSLPASAVDDVSQEVLASAWVNLKHLHSMGPAGRQAWVRIVFERRRADWFRSAYRHQSLVERSMIHSPSWSTFEDDVVARVDATYDEKRLRSSLTPREEDVAAMIGLGLSTREVADSLEVSVSAVKTYVARIRQRSASLQTSLDRN